MLSQSKNVDSDQSILLGFHWYLWVKRATDETLQWRLISQNTCEGFFFPFSCLIKREFALDQKLQGRTEAKQASINTLGLNRGEKNTYITVARTHCHPQDSNNLGLGKTWRLLNRDQGQRELNPPVVSPYTHTHITSTQAICPPKAWQSDPSGSPRSLSAGQQNPRAHAIWQIHWALSY